MQRSCQSCHRPQSHIHLTSESEQAWWEARRAHKTRRSLDRNQAKLRIIFFLLFTFFFTYVFFCCLDIVDYRSTLRASLSSPLSQDFALLHMSCHHPLNLGISGLLGKRPRCLGDRCILPKSNVMPESVGHNAVMLSTVVNSWQCKVCTQGCILLVTFL